MKNTNLSRFGHPLIDYSDYPGYDDFYNCLDEEERAIWSELKRIIPEANWKYANPHKLCFVSKTLSKFRKIGSTFTGSKTLRKIANSTLFTFGVSVQDRKRLGLVDGNNSRKT